MNGPSHDGHGPSITPGDDGVVLPMEGDVIASQQPVKNPTHPAVPEGENKDKTADPHENPQDRPAPAPAGDPEHLTRVASGPAYTVFSRGTRRWLVLMACIGSFVSPMTATIYYPVLDSLALDLNVGIGLINLTITSYMIFQAISPTLYGDFGDMAGRRPALILAFLVYLCANIGLALQRNYAALLVLRMLQSAGGSGTIALSFAMVADVTMSSERGKYMGLLGCGVNVGPTIGPVIGGIMNYYLGWPSIFWFSAVLAVVWLIPFALTVPETCRAVVGNGSVAPQGWNKTVLEVLGRGRTPSHDEHDPDSSATDVPRKLRFPNPLRAIKLVFEKELALVFFYNSILYTGFVVVAATLATLFKDIYDFSELELGLCYLPYGAGCCVASIGQGYLLDWNYRRTARNVGFAIDRRRGDDLLHFPIERARLEPVFPALALGLATLAAYGWVLHAETSVAVPLVLQFVIGLCITGSFGVMNTLIVDLNSRAPATGTAANNLVRCLMGAGGTAVVEYIIYGIGRGWCFTLLAVLAAVLSPMLWAIIRFGPGWRLEKWEAEQREQQRRQQGYEQEMVERQDQEGKGDGAEAGKQTGKE